MLEKLVIFGIGYVLGTRAGKERFDEIVETAKKFAARDDVQMVVSLATGFLEERIISTVEHLRGASLHDRRNPPIDDPLGGREHTRAWGRRTAALPGLRRRSGGGVSPLCLDPRDPSWARRLGAQHLRRG